MDRQVRKTSIGIFVATRDKFTIRDVQAYIKEVNPNCVPTAKEVGQLLRPFNLERDIVKSNIGQFVVYKKIA